MKKLNQNSRVVNLCGKGCCPVIEIHQKEVRIGEKGNLCILKRDEWEVLKKKIKENRI